MRPALTALALIAVVPLAACTVRTTTSDPAPTPDANTSQMPAPAPPADNGRPGLAQPNDKDKQPANTDTTFPEVVYVFQRDHLGRGWMCTGTLVSKRTVLTAAHCIDPKEFVSFEIVAPNAPNEPRVAASNPKVFGGTYENVANPDVGMLTLVQPIELPAYAEITDVVSRVVGGEKLAAAALVRIDVQPEAPLEWSDNEPLSSTVDLGYEHGFGTPMFSKGGDSGAGLFLVENGTPTHKLIGVARQPEPERNLDHFTRIDAAFTEWFAANVDTKNN